MPDESAQIERRTRRYFYDDGLTEMAAGVALLLLGSYFYGLIRVPSQSSFRVWIDSSFLLIAVCGGLILSRTISFLKDRITYRRTGFVSYKKKELSPGRQKALLLVAAFVAMGVSSAIVIVAPIRMWMPVLNGALLGGVACFIATKTGGLRFYLLGASSLLIGLGVFFAGMRDMVGTTLYYILFGIVVAVSGIVTFILYLLNSSPREEQS